MLVPRAAVTRGLSGYRLDVAWLRWYLVVMR